ncbi:MAG: cupin domain-containing protein [Bacteroides sp.]|nr:cupin domain-containing protein [Bacteroides sp.]
MEKVTPWESVGTGVSRQIMVYNDDLMLVKVKFKKGAKGSPYSHPYTQATCVAEGKFEFSTEGETCIVEKGDSIYIKPDAQHGCTCLEAGVLIDTFSPVREDFLK